MVEMKGRHRCKDETEVSSSIPLTALQQLLTALRVVRGRGTSVLLIWYANAWMNTLA
jgi:hypothetical protein